MPRISPPSVNHSIPHGVIDAALSAAPKNDHYGQFLFNTLRMAVLYLDPWGNICSANYIAQYLFDSHDLCGKNIMEILSGWDDPSYCHQEIMRVARTGTPVLGAVERVVNTQGERWFQTDKIAVKDNEQGIDGVVFTLDDITLLKLQEANLSQSEARYRAFVENSQDGIWRFDIDPPIPLDMDPREMITALLERATIGDCNAIFAKVCGMESVEQAYGLPLQKVSAKSYRQDARRFILNNYRLTNHESLWHRPDGKQLCLQTSAQGTIENNKLVNIWGVTRDATEHRQYIDRLEYQATHDGLTGLPNRTKLREIVDDAIASYSSEHQMALIIIDLDRFKEINDTLGHHVGDSVIQEIGPRIKNYLSMVPATIARLGGDEFAIFLPEIKDSQQVKLIGWQLLECIRQDLEIDSMHVEIRASAGIAMFPDQAKDFPTLLRYADVAMYCAKKDMSSVALYNPDKDLHSPKRLLLMGELGKAIRNDSLTLHYQPKISLNNNHVVGVEALARWNHPTMGFISPAEFVPIAEMTDLINELTDWVLDKSLLQVSNWRKQGLDIKVAVNISARNLLNNNLCEKIQVLLSDYNLPANCLELEITESTLMLNAEKTVPLLKDINDLGIELSIDDFGTGYSSLAYLKRLPVKWLKIDYSFIIKTWFRIISAIFKRRGQLV